MEGPSILTIPTFEDGILHGDVQQPKQDIYTENVAQQYAPGTKLIYPDGRVFRYGKNGGTALSKALMTTSEALTAAALEEVQTTSGTGVAVGDLEIVVDVTTGTTWPENRFAGGFLVVNLSTGIGDIYKILANQIDGSDDTLMRLRLETPIRTAWAATTEITFALSPWVDVDVMPTTAEGTPAGIPLIDVTANYWCWLQTGGYAPCLVDTSETLVKGEPAGHAATSNVAGACGPIGADTDSLWGTAVYIGGAAAECAILDLKLDS
jgi:hypothetical protein